MDVTLVMLATALTRRCSRTLVTPEELAFAKRRAKSVSLEETRPMGVVVVDEINERPTEANVLIISTIEMNA